MSGPLHLGGPLPSCIRRYAFFCPIFFCIVVWLSQFNVSACVISFCPVLFIFLAYDWQIPSRCTALCMLIFCMEKKKKAGNAFFCSFWSFGMSSSSIIFVPGERREGTALVYCIFEKIPFFPRLLFLCIFLSQPQPFWITPIKEAPMFFIWLSSSCLHLRCVVLEIDLYFFPLPLVAQHREKPRCYSILNSWACCLHVVISDLNVPHDIRSEIRGCRRRMPLRTEHWKRLKYAWHSRFLWTAPRSSTVLRIYDWNTDESHKRDCFAFAFVDCKILVSLFSCGRDAEGTIISEMLVAVHGESTHSPHVWPFRHSPSSVVRSP